MSKTLKHAVLFDMDGVLVDSEPVILAAAMQGLKEYGVNSKSEDFKPFVGAGEDRFIGGVAEKYGVAYKTEMKARVYEIYLELVSANLKVYDGIKDVLDSLKNAGWVLAVASSADRIKIEANLKVAGIPLSYFDVILSGEDVVQKKPFPEIYLKTAEKLGVKPACCFVVEDAVNGIKAAKTAGMRCIAVTTSFPKNVLEKESPDYIIDRVADVYNVLSCI